MLKREDVIHAWHARQILAGEDRNNEIQRHLRAASVVLVLVSASYLASSELRQTEMTPALEQSWVGKTRVILVLVRACNWKMGPLAELSPLPRNEVAITSWHNRDEAWKDVAGGIREAIFGSLSAKHRKTHEPAYENDEIRALAARLERARMRRTALEDSASSTADVDREILNLRRSLREGGQLRAGDAVEDERYLLLKLIGQGGFASVWAACDRAHGERVAIKVLHPAHARDPLRCERFFRGARVMSGLTHPAVVRVLQSRGEDGGYLYFVMELAEGGDLYRAVLGGRLPKEETVPLILRVGEALAEAHAKGIVHRDVKPANILIDSAGAPWLTDFDLVAAMDTTGGTRTGAMGTFLFAAPEQIRNASEADARADVYGLAMTAMFCLHGGDLPAIAVRRPDRVIERLSCSDAVKGVLTKAIELEPEDRYANARAFCEALQEARDLDARPEPPVTEPDTEREPVLHPESLTPEVGLESTVVVAGPPALVPVLGRETLPPGQRNDSDSPDQLEGAASLPAFDDAESVGVFRPIEVSPELEQVLAAAEQRTSVIVGQELLVGTSTQHTGEFDQWSVPLLEEPDIPTPTELLAALDEPLDPDDEPLDLHDEPLDPVQVVEPADLHRVWSIIMESLP